MFVSWLGGCISYVVLDYRGTATDDSFSGITQVFPSALCNSLLRSFNMVQN